MKKKIVKDINDEGSARASSSGAAQDNSDKIDEQTMAEPLSQGLGSKSWELFGISIGSISMGGLGGIEELGAVWDVHWIDQYGRAGRH